MTPTYGFAQFKQAVHKLITQSMLSKDFTMYTMVTFSMYKVYYKVIHHNNIRTT
jgi:hypothetical protein